MARWEIAGFRPGFWPQGQYHYPSPPGAQPRLSACPLQDDRLESRGPSVGWRTAAEGREAVGDDWFDPARLTGGWVLYLVAGRTHPEVARLNGEEYRLLLERRAVDLGVADHVEFDDRFLSIHELADLLHATDVFLTPRTRGRHTHNGVSVRTRTRAAVT